MSLAIQDISDNRKILTLGLGGSDERMMYWVGIGGRRFV